MTRDELLHLIAQGEGQQMTSKKKPIKPGRLQAEVFQYGTPFALMEDPTDERVPVLRMANP